MQYFVKLGFMRNAILQDPSAALDKTLPKYILQTPFHILNMQYSDISK